jgi:hypothetical protein
MRQNLTFVASETMLVEGGLCPGFAYVTVLRDPVARLQSQFERMSSQPNHRLHALLSRPHVYNETETSSLMGTAAVDNYVTRMLLGPPAFFLPLRGINASHLRAASAVLAGFAAAVPLDDLSSDDGTAWLRATLRWRGTPRKTNAHHRREAAAGAAGAVGRRLAARGRLGERSLRLLRELNQYDAQLYAQAKARFREALARGAAAPLLPRRAEGACRADGPQCSQARRPPAAGAVPAAAAAAQPTKPKGGLDGVGVAVGMGLVAARRFAPSWTPECTLGDPGC